MKYFNTKVMMVRESNIFIMKEMNNQYNLMKIKHLEIEKENKN